MTLLIIPKPKPTNTINNANHQYSERDARPLKSAYLDKQVLIDSTNVIFLFLLFNQIMRRWRATVIKHTARITLLSAARTGTVLPMCRVSAHCIGNVYRGHGSHKWGND